MTDPARPADQPRSPVAATGGYRFTPAEIQQQLIQCTDLLQKFEISYSLRAEVILAAGAPAPDTEGSVPQAHAVSALGGRAQRRVDNQFSFLRNWYDALIAARTRYLEQEHITEAQWNALASEGLPE